MSFRHAFSLAVLPGLALVLASFAGWVPAARDNPTYFVPLRAQLARAFTGEASPWLNPQVGCGEPFFANPQSALLYPPAWGALLLPPERAVGVEVGLHLMLLALGVARLGRRLGGTPTGSLAAAWGAALSGPVLSSAGMLNNLETAAWLPWVWEAALAGRLGILALTVAGSFLAAEPVLALLGAAGAVLLLPRWQTVRAVLLGFALCSVQALPMAFWIAGGDRGPDKPLESVSLGGVSLGELPALVVPGFPLPPVEVRFLPIIVLPLWLFLALGSLRRGETARTRLVFLAAVFAFLAVLPALPWGDALWAGLSFGLVRLPGRFLIPATVALAAVAGSGKLPQSRKWVAVALGLGAVGAVVSWEPWLAAGQGVLAALAPWGMGWAAAGSLFLATYTVPVLQLQKWKPEPVLCLSAQSAGRLYPLPVDGVQLRWTLERGTRGAASLGWGYSVLLDGRSLARSFAPVTNRALAQHLAQADRGFSEGGWWVSALGAKTIVGLHPIPGYPPLCQQDKLWVFRNPSAFPLWAVVSHLPTPGELPVPAGEAVLKGQGRTSWQFQVRAQTDGVFLWLFAPDPGWRFVVDGKKVKPIRGAGILQGVPVAAGDHEVRVVYRPPGLLAGLVVSLASLFLLGVLWRR